MNRSALRRSSVAAAAIPPRYVRRGGAAGPAPAPAAAARGPSAVAVLHFGSRHTAVATRPALAGWLPRGEKVVAQAAGGGSDGASGQPEDDAPKAAALTPKMPGVGYTFVLAGFLKILTIGGLASSAPQDAVRTAFGHFSPYLLVPFGLLLCWVAKLVTDANLQENNKFLALLVGGCLLLYFGLYRMLYRVDVIVERARRPQPLTSAPMADVRARAGDRDRSGLILRDSRTYRQVAEGQSFDDLAYYEGRTPSVLRASADAPASASADASAETSAAPPGARSAADLDARNPLRQQYRRAPGVAPISTYGPGGGGSGSGGAADMDAVMRPR